MILPLAMQHWQGDGCSTDAASDNALADRIVADERSRGAGFVTLARRYPHTVRQPPHPSSARYDELRAALR